MRRIKQFLAIGIFAAIATGSLFAQNYKIRQSVSMNGQKSESTVYVKGSRKRTESGGYMGMGGDVADVEQCDLKRNLKISDKKKMYAVEPFDDGSDTPATTTPVSTTKAPKAKIEKGGTITYTSNVNDTGERKQMFGLTARHIKTSMSMQATPDACSKQNMKIETDGWYIDLPEFSCSMTQRPQVPQMPTERNEGGCRDKMIFETSGSGKLGFPLTETRTISMDGMDMSFTQSTETLEFSKATLDNILFDIPTGYSLTANSQDLYGRPDMSAMMRNMGNSDNDDKPAPTSSTNNNSPASMPAIGTKRVGVIRIGVFAPTNKSGENVSITNLQSFLIQKLSGANVEAVSVGSESDAKAANCDYMLMSDFSKLKQSTASKIGGMFGKVTNTDTSSTRNYDAQVDYKLVPLAGGKAVSNKASGKSESDVDRAAEAVLSQEASAILSAIN